MSGLLPSKAKKKKKRAHDDHPNLKRVKLDNNSNGNGSKNPSQFETTLSQPIQEALCKFREASEQELLRLRKEGMDPSTAINKLMEKMRTAEGGVQPSFTRQELELVMEMAGVNEEGATRALILRSELAKLRHDGFNHPEAINELSRRMKRLAGSKRRGSSSFSEKLEGKHRKKDTNNNTNNTTTPTSTTLTTNTTTPSRVSFTHNLNTLSHILPLGQLPLSGISRKRLQDALMLDEGQYELLRKRIRFDNKDESEDSSSDGENYGLLEHEDEEEDKYDGLEEDGEEDLDNGFPLHTFTTNYTSSSEEEHIFNNKEDEEELEDEDDEEEEEEGWRGSHVLFHDIKEEEESDDGEWHLVGPSISTTSAPLISSPPTTNTTTTTTTTTSSSSLFSFLSSTHSPPPSPPTTTTSRTTTHTTKPPKRRDSPPPSNRAISRRTLS